MSVGVLERGAGSLEWPEEGKASDYHGLTLVTQCSLARLYKLPPLTVHWKVSSVQFSSVQFSSVQFCSVQSLVIVIVFK